MINFSLITSYYYKTFFYLKRVRNIRIINAIQENEEYESVFCQLYN